MHQGRDIHQESHSQSRSPSRSKPPSRSKLSWGEEVDLDPRDPNLKLLASAAEVTLERIRQDRQRAPAQVRPLLAYLEIHLFQAGLDVKRVKQACGVRDNTLPLCFHNALSLPPYAYIEDCRMDVACNLLRDTDLKIWQIAGLLGYSTLQVFSRAFKRWSGVRPSDFRVKAAQMPTIPLSVLVKTAEGGLKRHEADELSRYLTKLYPESFAFP